MDDFDHVGGFTDGYFIREFKEIQAGAAGEYLYTLLFQLYVRNDNTKARLVTLKCMVGPVDVDDPRPALSIMMKDED